MSILDRFYMMRIFKILYMVPMKNSIHYFMILIKVQIMKLQTNKLLIKHLSPSQLFLHLCAHSKIHNQCVLLKLMVRLRECGLKLYSNLIPKLIPILLLICQHILKLLIFTLSSKLIHTTYLYSDSDLDTQFQLWF